MALINCPECTREISDKAASCPHCGYPIESHQSEPPKEDEKAVVASLEKEPEELTPAEIAEKESDARRNKFAIFAIATIVIAIIIAIATGAGSNTGKKPKNMSQECYKEGRNALSIADQLLDNRIDADVAFDRLYWLSKRIDYPKEESGLPVYSLDPSLSISVGTLELRCMFLADGQATLESVVEARNDLAELLNEETR